MRSTSPAGRVGRICFQQSPAGNLVAGHARIRRQLQTARVGRNQSQGLRSLRDESMVAVRCPADSCRSRPIGAGRYHLPSARGGLLQSRPLQPSAAGRLLSLPTTKAAPPQLPAAGPPALPAPPGNNWLTSSAIFLSASMNLPMLAPPRVESYVAKPFSLPSTNTRNSA